MSLERLAVMFGGCGSYQSGARSTAGELLSRVELAGVMSGLTDAERDYVYAFFGDEASVARFARHVEQFAAVLADRDNWRAFAEMPLLLSSTAVRELLNNRCSACNGTGTKKLKSCAKCGGVGQVRLSSRSIAAVIGIDQSNYVRTWRGRYDRIFVHAQDIQCAAVMKIRRAQRRDIVFLA